MELFLFVFWLTVIIITTPTMVYGCFEVEREALVTFKAGLHDPENLMSSWQGKNCCSWSGVTCGDDINEHVLKLNLRNSDPYDSTKALSGEINPALLSLRYLTHLDLSGNNFQNLSIPKFIGSFENLVYLNLSFSSFQGLIPYELGNLSRLQYLDLSYCEFTGIIPPELGNLSNLQYLDLAGSYDMTDNSNLSWLYHLSYLRYLDMSGVGLYNGVDWLAINKMHLLQTLILNGCLLPQIPNDVSIVNLTFLTKLDLSDNLFRGTPPNWLWNLTSLLYLDLGLSWYQGSFPSALSNLVSLNYLSLRNNDFDHVFLEPINKLQNLRTLDLSFLNIGGDIVDLIRSLGDMWYNLEEVYLRGNNLFGNISSWIAQMRKLSIIDLSNNFLSGHITNQVGKVSHLKELYLYKNSLSGFITEKHFANLTNLSILVLSGNRMLTMKTNDKWVPPFQLQILSLSSCKVGPSFPSWIRGQTQLRIVELSNTSLTGAIPTWLWNIPIEYIYLSDNKITKVGGVNLTLSNDSGQIPSSWGTLEFLDLSRNQIKGTIPYDICEMINLYLLDISNNALYGEIPSCWKNDSNLEFMVLSNNQITGQLPLSIGSLQYLSTLQLDDNKLHGEVPSTLQRCNSLEFLSLGRNNFSGKIPPWIGKQLQNLVVLQLCSNKFTGYIPSELAELSQLHILDLSHNLLVGTIPYFVGSFSGMKNSSSDYYSYYSDTYEVTLYIDINGQRNYASTPLDFAKTIDISGNNLTGEIPEELWLLQGVINLNLCKNNFMGEIPEAIGGMRALESLDLSLNNFSGPIPQALSSLSSLHSLNLSYNNFSGPIPTGRQLDTISGPLDYIGNPFLCGAPIGKSCDEVQTSIGIDIAHGDNENEMVWLYLVIALGFVLGFWSVWGVLIFINAWKVTYFQMIDKLFDKIYVHIVLAIRRLA